MNSKILWICFALLVLLQLWVPAALVVSRENTLRNGVSFKFKTAPVDPTDLFRGKYIYLDFAERGIKLSGKYGWDYQEQIFVSLREDKDGFARIKSVSNRKPTNGDPYLEANARYAASGKDERMNIEWPFERYYMEESKAPAAEIAYNKVTRDTAKTAYALVKIKDGVAVLENVYLDGKPIESYLK
jgi:uncharacterized membrane-anchored protein